MSAPSHDCKLQKTFYPCCYFAYGVARIQICDCKHLKFETLIAFIGMRSHHLMEIQNPTLGWRLIWPEVWFLRGTLQKVQSPEKCQMGTVRFQFSRILGIFLNLLSPIACFPTFAIILLKKNPTKPGCCCCCCCSITTIKRSLVLLSIIGAWCWDMLNLVLSSSSANGIVPKTSGALTFEWVVDSWNIYSCNDVHKRSGKKSNFSITRKVNTGPWPNTGKKKKKAVLLAVYSYASKQIDGSQILILVSFFFICFYTIWYAGWSLGQYLSQEVQSYAAQQNINVFWTFKIIRQKY